MKGLPIHAIQPARGIIDFSLCLSEHGTRQAPPLTETQKKLLGR